MSIMRVLKMSDSIYMSLKKYISASDITIYERIT